MMPSSQFRGRPTAPMVSPDPAYPTFGIWTSGYPVVPHPDSLFPDVVGRGGANNVRDPSGDPGRFPHDPLARKDVIAESIHDPRVMREHAGARTHHTGRDDVGNITHSRSRSRSSEFTLRSTGRGGVGNIRHAENLDGLYQEEERRNPPTEGIIHSTGRGGIVNLTDAVIPNEPLHHRTGQYESSGHGGSDNIGYPSQTRRPGSRDPNKEGHDAAVLRNKMAHPGSHPHGRVGQQGGP